MSEVPEAQSPWPGPRPYEECEWPIFFGRRREVDQVLQRFSINRLTLLSGASGTGKTSLLRAGIVPRLRLRRYRDRVESVWPVLVIRDWGLGAGSDFSEVWKDHLLRSLEALDPWRRLGEKFSATGTEEDRTNPDPASDQEAIAGAIRAGGAELPLAAVERITCEGGISGLYLVLDQFEEVLRFGKSTAKEIVRFVKELYESGLPVKTLISLRQEHLVDLRDLERTVGGLMGQTVFLVPMDNATARDAMQAAARERGVELGEYVVGEIIKLMGAGLDERYNLLALQAVLYDFFAEVLREHRAVTREQLDAYCAKQAGQGLTGESVVDYALKKWIERALGEPADVAAAQDGVPPAQADALVRRVAIRLAPNLSSGGFKMAQEDADLRRKATGDDLRRLGVATEKLQGLRLLSRQPLRLDTTELGLDGRPETAALRLSGLAYASRWSTARTADVVVSSYYETLRRLAKGNVIKSVLAGTIKEGGERWELVHDGLGAPFVNWANEREEDWDDCRASLVACLGITPIQVKPEDSRKTAGEHIEHVRWEGCLITPSSGNGLPTFDNVVFESCALRGSVFEAAIFRGCKFLACDLNGTIFKGCEFLAGDAPCTVESCAPESLAIIASKLSGLRFLRCDLSQLTLRDLEIRGAPIEFAASVVSLSNFVGLTSLLEGPAVLFDAACSMRFCAGDDDSWELLDYDAIKPERSKNKRRQR
jgi:hypothetical protein